MRILTACGRTDTAWFTPTSSASATFTGTSKVAPYLNARFKKCRALQPYHTWHLAAGLRPQRPGLHGAHDGKQPVIPYRIQHAAADLGVGQPAGSSALDNETQDHLAILNVWIRRRPLGRPPGPGERIGRRAAPDVKKATRLRSVGNDPGDLPQRFGSR